MGNATDPVRTAHRTAHLYGRIASPPAHAGGDGLAEVQALSEVFGQLVAACIKAQQRGHTVTLLVSNSIVGTRIDSDTGSEWRHTFIDGQRVRESIEKQIERIEDLR